MDFFSSLLGLIGVPIAAAAQSAAPRPVTSHIDGVLPAQAAQAVIADTCLRCHNDQARRGNLSRNLGRLFYEAVVIDGARRIDGLAGVASMRTDFDPGSVRAGMMLRRPGATPSPSLVHRQ